MMPSRSLNVVISGDARGFRGAVRSVEQDTDRLDRHMRRASKATETVGDGFGQLSLRVGSFAGSLGSMAPLVAGATPALVALAGSAAAVGASFGAAAAGAGALGAGLGASLAPFLVLGKQVVSRFDEIKKAYAAVQTAQKEGTEASRKNADQALANLSKSERAMVQSFGKLSDLQKKVLGPASDRVIGSLSAAIDRLAPSLEKLSGPFARLGDAVGGSIERIAKVLSGPTWTGALKQFVDSATGLVGPFTTIFLSIARILRDVAVSALPMVSDAVKAVADAFSGLDSQAGTSKIQAVVKGLVDQTKSWFNLFLGVGKLLFTVFSGGAEQGQGLVDSITQIVNKWNDWLSSDRGQHALLTFFKAATDGARAMARVIGTIVGVTATVVGAIVSFAGHVHDTFSGGDASATGSVNRFGRNARETFGRVKDFIVSLVDRAREEFGKMRADLSSIGRNLGKMAAAASDVVTYVAKRLLPRLAEAFGGLATVVRGVVKIIAGILSGDFSKAWEGAKLVVKGALTAIRAVIRGAWDVLGPAMVSLAKFLIRKLGDGLAALPGALKDALVAAIKFAARAVPRLIGAALKGLGGAITAGIKAGFGALNPFKGIGDGDGYVGLGAALPAAFGGGLHGANPAMAPFAGAAARFGLQVTSGRDDHSKFTASGNLSYHGSGEAIDVSNGVATPQEMAFARYMVATQGPRLAELIYTPLGFSIKNGRKVAPIAASDHFDHVHVAVDLGARGVGDGTGRRPRTGDGLGRFEATSYGPPWGGIQGTGVTSTGVNLKGSPHRYGVAVDPRVIPLGTKLKITPNPFGYSGAFTAFDTGGAIKGHRLDFYDWRGRAAQNRWGRHTVSVSTYDAPGGRHGGTVTSGTAKTGKPAGPKGTTSGSPYAAQETTDIPFDERRQQHEDALAGRTPRVYDQYGNAVLFTGPQRRMDPTGVLNIGSRSGGPAKGASGPRKGLPAGYEAPEPRDAPVDPTHEDYIRSNIARAKLTEGLQDDVLFTREMRDVLKNAMDAALADLDPRNDQDAIDAYLSAKDAVESLEGTMQTTTDTLQANTDAMKAHTDALTGVQDELKRQTDVATSIQSTESFQLKRYAGRGCVRGVRAQHRPARAHGRDRYRRWTLLMAETFTLDGLNLNDGTTFTIDIGKSVDMTPPRQKPEYIGAADSEAQLLMRAPGHDNRRIVLPMVITQQATYDLVYDKVGLIVDKLAKASKYQGGIALAWTTGTRTVTFDVLSGEIAGFPLDLESGWASRSPRFAIELTCKPYWYGTEVLTATATASTPVTTLEVPNVTGDVPALGRLIVTDMATQSRRFVEWGLEGPLTYTPGTSLILDSDSLVVTGFSGSQTTVATNTYDPNATGNNAVAGGAYLQTAALCGTGNQPHVGSFLVRGRIMTALAGTVMFRLSWQVDDGPFTANPWVVPDVTFDWVERALGTVTVPAGSSRWTGRVEVALNPANLGPSGTGVYVDYLELVPVSCGYGKARAVSMDAPGVLTGLDSFTSTTAGVALNGRTAPLGGTWATSGDATDFAFADPFSAYPALDETVKRSAASGTAGRIALLGTGTPTDVQVETKVFLTDLPTAVFPNALDQGVVARYVNSTNYLYATLRHAYVGSMAIEDLSRTLEIRQVVAGVDSQVAFGAYTGITGAKWWRVTLTAYATGTIIARLLSDAGQEVVRVTASSSVLATGGALASGKSGLFDRMADPTTFADRYYDDFAVSTPAAEPIALYSGRTLEVTHEKTVRLDSTGVYPGRPASYNGSRFLVPPGTSRVAVLARRNDIEAAVSTNVTDSTRIQVGWTPRGTAVPR
jgi:3D (Asp-Asp-Asp) domain-containing protein